MRPSRAAGVVGGLLLVSVVLRLVTWSPVADGPHARYVRTVVAGAVSVIAVYALTRRVAPVGAVPIVASVATLVAVDALHYVRLAHPVSRGAPVVEASARFTGGTAPPSGTLAWEVESDRGGRATWTATGLTLEAPALGVAYVRPHVSGLPNVAVQWWLPLGLAVQGRRERLAWRASVERSGPFFVIGEARGLLIQSTAGGLHITYPDAEGAARGHELPAIDPSDGRPRDWLLTRDQSEVSLSIDGRRVWAQPQRGELSQVRLGETKSDPAHGGRLVLESASFEITLDRTVQAFRPQS